nr:unnamed protein product [Digitaria exilis]
MREAFQAVSPCLTTTTSVNSSLPLGAGVGDMAWLFGWWCRALLASAACSRERGSEYLADTAPGVNGSFQEAAPAGLFCYLMLAAGVVGLDAVEVWNTDR